MFSLKNDSPDTGGGKINAILGKGAQFDGKLIFEGTVRIDGKFNGEIISNDRLLVGESADVNAQIKVDSIVISGSVVGDIEAKTKVEIQAPGKLKGNIKAPSLVINEGVTFDGHCSMTGGKASAKTDYVADAEVVSDPKFKKQDSYNPKKHS